MSNPGISLTAQPDYAFQLSELQRKQKLAELLQQQSSEPIGIQTGGGQPAPIAWTSLLAKALQAGGGAYLSGKAAQDQKSLGEQDAQSSQDLVQALMRAKTNTIGSDGIAPSSQNLAAPPGMSAGDPVSIPGMAGTPATSTPDTQRQLAMLLGASGGPRTEAIRNAMLPQVFQQQNYDRNRNDLKADRAETRGFQISDEARERQQALDDQSSGLKRQEDLALYQNKLGPTAYQKAELAERLSAAGNANPFGKGMTGKAYAILAQGDKDPSVRGTPEYKTAWQILSNPHVDPNTGTVIVPDMSAYQPPSGMSANGQPGGQRMPSIQGFAPPNPSQPEAASAGYANRLAESSKQIDQYQGALTNLGQHAKAGVPIVGNYLASPEYQQGNQAERNFINAQLRRESGAAIAESEFENARKQYIPQPGDSPQVLAQKQAARAMAVQNMQLSAGNTLLPPGVIQQSSPPRGAPMVPQQQGFGQPLTPRVRKYNPQTGQIE